MDKHNGQASHFQENGDAPDQNENSEENPGPQEIINLSSDDENPESPDMSSDDSPEIITLSSDDEDDDSDENNDEFMSCQPTTSTYPWTTEHPYDLKSLKIKKETLEETMKTEVSSKKSDASSKKPNHAEVNKVIGQKKEKQSEKVTSDGHTASTRSAHSNITKEGRIQQIHKIKGLLTDEEKEKKGPSKSEDSGPVSTAASSVPPIKFIKITTATSTITAASSATSSQHLSSSTTTSTGTTKLSVPPIHPVTNVPPRPPLPPMPPIAMCPVSNSSLNPLMPPFQRLRTSLPPPGPIPPHLFATQRPSELHMLPVVVAANKTGPTSSDDEPPSKKQKKEDKLSSEDEFLKKNKNKVLKEEEEFVDFVNKFEAGKQSVPNHPDNETTSFSQCEKQEQDCDRAKLVQKREEMKKAKAEQMPNAVAIISASVPGTVTSGVNSTNITDTSVAMSTSAMYYQTPSYMSMQPCMSGATTAVVPAAAVPPAIVPPAVVQTTVVSFAVAPPVVPPSAVMLPAVPQARILPVSMPQSVMPPTVLPTQMTNSGAPPGHSGYGNENNLGSSGSQRNKPVNYNKVLKEEEEFVDFVNKFEAGKQSVPNHPDNETTPFSQCEKQEQDCDRAKLVQKREEMKKAKAEQMPNAVAIISASVPGTVTSGVNSTNITDTSVAMSTSAMYYQTPSYMSMQPCMSGATTAVVPAAAVPPAIVPPAVVQTTVVSFAVAPPVVPPSAVMLPAVPQARILPVSMPQSVMPPTVLPTQMTNSSAPPGHSGYGNENNLGSSGSQRNKPVNYNQVLKEEEEFVDFVKMFEAGKQSVQNHPEKGAFSQCEKQEQDCDRAQLVQKREQIKKAKAEQMPNAVAIISASVPGIVTSEVNSTNITDTSVAMSTSAMYYQTPSYMSMQPCLSEATTAVVPAAAVPPATVPPAVAQTTVVSLAVAPPIVTPTAVMLPAVPQARILPASMAQSVMPPTVLPQCASSIPTQMTNSGALPGHSGYGNENNLGSSGSQHNKPVDNMLLKLERCDSQAQDLGAKIWLEKPLLLLSRCDDEVQKSGAAVWREERIVWAKFGKKTYWPAVIFNGLQIKEDNKPKHKFVLWFKTHNYSQVKEEFLCNFIVNFNSHFSEDPRKLKAILEAVQLMAEMSAMSEMSDSELITWGTSGFRDFKNRDEDYRQMARKTDKPNSKTLFNYVEKY